MDISKTTWIIAWYFSLLMNYLNCVEFDEGFA